MITEANIEITRKGDKLISISVLMPVWSKPSNCGNLLVKLPFLAIDTIAKDENDAETAIKEALQSFCIVAEKFGQGVEKELQSLGWTLVDQKGKPVVGYCVSDPDSLIDRLTQTGENYVNQYVEIEHALETAHA